MSVKPTAIKSFGEYKPMIRHASGRTEICGQRSKTFQIQAETKFYSGPSEVTKHFRGVTFKTRAEAVAFAQRDIDYRIQRRREAISAWKEKADAATTEKNRARCLKAAEYERRALAAMTEA
ncbi:MAG: hypothetical protein Unbinned3138contig1000_62 [Prokaryotic dsDNA virus sp.]|nr:MAG: hypothetical protein Unbinned3138contig1000_62 [Prokaryotic dsDNA virus sp.]|tara:strand:- start:1134 stop:1496 length:363 start_codon:yes stop_codon:yes gene_type:complete